VLALLSDILSRQKRLENGPFFVVGLYQSPALKGWMSLAEAPPVILEPLRNHLDDIEPLLRHFLTRAAPWGFDVDVFLSDDVVARLRSLSWNENLTQLNAVTLDALFSSLYEVSTLSSSDAIKATFISNIERAYSSWLRLSSLDARNGLVAGSCV
jgi:hypothetical protein